MKTEALLLWAAVALYAAAFALDLGGGIFRKSRARAIAWRVWIVGLAVHLCAGIGRWWIAGHAPVQGVYENSLSGSFAVAAVYLPLAWRLPALRRALPGLLAVVLLVLGNGITVRDAAVPLEPPFRSGWLVVHVAFAWLAFGAFLVSAVVAGLQLTTARRGGAGDRIAVLDDTCGRLIFFGFACDTIMIASGALWAHSLWGRYWGWDPVETWSLVTWLVYGANLHARLTLGWRGPRAAWLALASAVTVVITFFGIRFISDVHTELL